MARNGQVRRNVTTASGKHTGLHRWRVSSVDGDQQQQQLRPKKGAKLLLFIENFFQETSAHGFINVAAIGVHFIERYVVADNITGEARKQPVHYIYRYVQYLYRNILINTLCRDGEAEQERANFPRPIFAGRGHGGCSWQDRTNCKQEISEWNFLKDNVLVIERLAFVCVCVCSCLSGTGNDGGGADKDGDIF